MMLVARVMASGPRRIETPGADRYCMAIDVVVSQAVVVVVVIVVDVDVARHDVSDQNAGTSTT